MKILQLDSSVTGANSVSRPLTKAVAEKLLAKHPGAELAYRDLVDEPLSHYTAVLRVHGADLETKTPAQLQELKLGEEILAEFLATDIIVIGAPLYNFSIPSQLKAWIDLICVAGKTFSYSPAGAKGLCGGKQVVIVSTRGAMYGPGSPYEAFDFQEKYLKTVLGFLGITDIQVVRAEGIAYGPEAKEKALASAAAEIAAL
ncbi:FMN-dependent NADH-azoreductase [Granulicella rosea]|uniref:FMN dependent NADH:quinone oxidoreductase n=1 Tax=Granulicella rosea TaxID=474952 RepID=A0A239DGW2_9BACT|nr:NAD(P)H-dependent oxidoreductase [Granulicella rosea]SNS31650.1 FMN-dependent NADH-azoreductase [Granulicella rosea]